MTNIIFALILLLTSFAAPSVYCQGEPAAGRFATDSSRTEIVLRFGGDVLLAGRYEESVGANITRAFDSLDLFRSDDLSMANLECPVTIRGTKQLKPFTFRMKHRYLEAITSAGIDVVNIANNHIGDFGQEGLFDTIAALDSAGILHVGAGMNRTDAHRPVIKTVKGRKIGFLGYYSGGEAAKAGSKTAGVAPRELDQISNDICLLKQNDNVDYIVVNFHWGTEKARKPSSTQRAFARSIIDAGADAIIGHHPHVLQGIELYNHGVIVYSLGNLMFGGNRRKNSKTGVFEIRLSEEDRTYTFIPVRVSGWQASVLTGSEAESMLAEVKNLSKIFPKSIFNLKEIQ